MFLNNYLPDKINLMQLQQEAMQAVPQEAVWFVFEEGAELQENIAYNPEMNFKVSEEATAKAYQRGLLGIIHSHCFQTPLPSKRDMEGQIKTNVPWGILGASKEMATDIVWWGLPEPAPLLGRPFIFGVYDCYSLVRDYYLTEFNISLKEFPRDPSWYDEDSKMFKDHWEVAGFYPVPLETVQVGDMLVFDMGFGVPSHAAIYIGNGLVLHHPGRREPYDTTRLSVKVPIHLLRHYKQTCLRHKDVTVDEN